MTYCQCGACSWMLGHGHLTTPTPEVRYETNDVVHLDVTSYHALAMLRERWAGVDRPNVLIRGFG